VLFPDRDEYYADLNKGTIVFTGDLSLRVGEHAFHLLHTPGHTPGQTPFTCHRNAWSSQATAFSTAAKPG
jgi:glyoxylase-like metal-dependent hydrolase (beta-lactamase superfamily II)